MKELDEIRSAETAEDNKNDSPAKEAEVSEAEESTEEEKRASEMESQQENETEDISDEETPADEDAEKPGLLSRIGNWILIAFLVFATAFTAYVMINAGRGKAVSIFGNYVLRVTTGSMEPSIHAGDYIIVKKTAPEKLQVNDVITYYTEDKEIYGKMVTHRIVDINPDGTFITMGDANKSADELAVRKDQMVGRYTRKSRFFKWINSFADLKKLVALFVILPLTLIALYEVRTVMKLGIQVKHENDEEYKEKKQELIREAIEKEKQRLEEEARADKEKIDEPRTNNEEEND